MAKQQFIMFKMARPMVMYVFFFLPDTGKSALLTMQSHEKSDVHEIIYSRPDLLVPLKLQKSKSRLAGVGVGATCAPPHEGAAVKYTQQSCRSAALLFVYSFLRNTEGVITSVFRIDFRSRR